MSFYWFFSNDNRGCQLYFIRYYWIRDWCLNSMLFFLLDQRPVPEFYVIRFSLDQRLVPEFYVIRFFIGSETGA